MANRTSIPAGSVWMVAITLALFFAPGVNGLIGGLVGGYLVGGVKRALLAAILPAVVAAVALWLLLWILDLPVLGLFAGVAGAIAIVVSEFGLFIGAAIGGAVRGGRPEQPAHA
jgi:hypothetical protein